MAAAAEPADEFLDALKQRGYFELGLTYVDRAAANNRVSAEWKRAADFHRGVLRIEQARITPDAKEARSLLAEGIQTLQSFTKEHPDHPLAGSAQTWLAKSLAQRARIELVRFREASSDNDREAIAKSATQLFKKAKSEFKARTKTINAALEAVADDASASVERRDALRSDLIGTRLETATDRVRAS